MYNKNNIITIAETFIEQMKEQTFCKEEDIRRIIMPVIEEIEKNPDFTPNEIIQKLLDKVAQDLNEQATNILKEGNNILVPGYTMQIKVGNTNIKIYGGNFGNNKKLTNNAIFDIASISKMYTELVAYNLVNNGVFKFDDKISELDSRFTNLGDLTVGDITRFNASFKTPGRLDDSESREDALSKLYKTEVIQKGEYNYNDIGVMILKEVMESQTGMTYEELVNKFIISKFNLNETFITLPNDKKDIFTGSANDSLGKSNDAKAVVMGGASGHAGLKVSSDDLIKFAMLPYQTSDIPANYILDLYSKNPNRADGARGIVGSAKLANPSGLDLSDSPITSPIISNSAYGSTRTQYNSGKFKLTHDNVCYGSTVLLNPSSISIEKALKLENEINEKRKQGALAKGLEFKPISIVKELKILEDGKYNIYHQIDSRPFLPFGVSTDKLTTINGEITMQLLFIQELIKNYDKDYDLEYNKEIHINR